MKQFLAYVKTFVLKSWKTTVAGIALFVVGYLQQSGKISAETAGTIVTILAGLGFVASKDGNVSNGTTSPKN